MTRTLRLAAIGLVTLSALAPTALAEDKAKSVEGAWKQVEQKNGDAQEYQKFPEGIEMINLVTGGRFVWTVVSQGRVVSMAGGKYRVDGDKYSESLEFISGQGVPESF